MDRSNPCIIEHSMHFEYDDTDNPRLGGKAFTVWTIQGSYEGDAFMCTVIFDNDSRDADYIHIYGVDLSPESGDTYWDDLLLAISQEEK